MNKTVIKNFAIWARNKLIADVSYDARLIGITEDGIAKSLPQSFGGTQFFDIGTAEPYSISGEAVHQRDKLIEVIQQKEKDTDYKTAYQYVIEEVAYTWFNRLIAVRFMEVNDYLPSHIRVLSSESGKLEPDLVTTPFDAELPFTAEEEAQIFQLKQDNKLDEVFRILFLKQCNALNEILPALFEKTKNYTELLLSLSVTNQDGVVYHLIHDIPEDDFNIERGGQVEIIGWLYQYYNTEPKAAAFAKNGKITKEEIPAVTQLFTPDWIVRYMVENSLGRLWVEGHPDCGLKENWKYYLEEAQQEPEVQAKLSEIRKEYAALNPEDIKLIDPCMGSGHILVYAFDVLMQIYTSVGYSERDAANSIFEYNLYGLDIDDRAYQLAYFAVMMKARQYNRRILNGEMDCHIYSIQESNTVNRKHLKYLGAGMDELERNNALNQLTGLLDTFVDAKEYGSILNVDACDWDLLHRFVEQSSEDGQMTMDSFGLEDTKEQLRVLVDIGQVMAQKYDVVVTNPPYMGSSGMDAKLSDFAKKNYPDSKSDLFACCIEKGNQMTVKNGFNCMVTMQSWMFLSSFEKMRTTILLSKDITNLMHMENMVMGIAFGTVVTVFRNSYTSGYKGTYNHIKMQDIIDEVPTEFPISGNRFAQVSTDCFSKIPGSPVAYWVSEAVVEAFALNEKIGQLADPKQGSTLGDNATFIRYWFEIGDKKTKWFNCMKGGEFRRWYGNQMYVLDWEDDGKRVRSTGRATIRSADRLFQEGITWSNITSGKSSFRYMPEGFFFESTGSVCFSSSHILKYLLAYLNTPIAENLNRMINPTLHLQSGDVAKLPLRLSECKVEKVSKITGGCIDIAKTDWDSYETSWDFKRNPLVNSNRLTTAYAAWKQECEDRFQQLKKNEEELNRIFIDIYGLQDELTPEVADKDVTVHRVFDSKDAVPESMKGSNYVRTMRDEIVSLISYAMGCMFGRYSIYKDGLLFVGELYSLQAFVDKMNDRPETTSADELERVYRNEGVVVDEMFFPDADNVIPITDEEYLEDDIIARLCNWLKVVYGADTLEANLDYIAKALGNKGSTSREIIRNYFLKDFFKDHCKIYQKRPIYWLFDSGNQNGFKALVYLHRYTPDTIGNLRIDYLHKMQRVYESEINRMQDMMDHSENAREVAVASKRKDKLCKQLKECREYDEKISHLALSRIELDLDDGVKVNYEKVQTVDGVKYPVLTKI